MNRERNYFFASQESGFPEWNVRDKKTMNHIKGFMDNFFESFVFGGGYLYGA